MTDLHEDNDNQRAPGYDPELHDCSVCLDTGLSLIDGSYCDGCQLGAARARQDKFSDELQAHGFKPAMWVVFRSTQKTERAIAAAEKALLLDKLAKLEAKQQWINLKDQLPEKGQLVWCARKDRRVHLAKRDSDKPLATGEPWNCCYWRDQEIGSNWSDVTVEAWMPVPERVRPVAPSISTNGEQN